MSAAAPLGAAAPAGETLSVRLEVFTRTRYADGRARRILPLLQRAVSPAVVDVAIVDVYLLSGIPGMTPDIAADVFQDAVAQEILANRYAAEEAFKGSWDHLVEVTAKPGVTDPVALTAREALHACLPGGIPPAAVIQTAVQYLVRLDVPRMARASEYRDVLQRAP